MCPLTIQLFQAILRSEVVPIVKNLQQACQNTNHFYREAFGTVIQCSASQTPWLDLSQP